MAETSLMRGAAPAVAFSLLLLLAVLDALALGRLAGAASAEALAEVLAILRGGDFAAAVAAAAARGLLPWLALPILGPLAIAPAALLAGRRRPAPAAPRGTAGSVTTEPPVPSPVVAPAPSPAVGLRLLAVLQEEARLVDFVREDISEYSDEQVGSAVRGIHAALRKAIDDRLVLEPILPGEDGDRVQVPVGFEPASIRLTGHPTGRPPYAGVLRHGGWRAREVRLPVPTEGSDPAILMPAEVEVE